MQEKQSMLKHLLLTCARREKWIAGASVSIAPCRLEVILLQKKMFGKLPNIYTKWMAADGSTKYRFFLNFYMSLKEWERFLQRCIPIVIAKTDHRNFRTTLFNDCVHCIHSVGLWWSRVSNLWPFKPEFSVITTRQPRLSEHLI